MSAFRFAKLHGISLGRAEYWEDKDYELFSNVSRSDSSGIGHAALRHSNGFYFLGADSRIAFSKYSSQRKKNLCVWHEIGHWIDFRQNYNKVRAMPIVLREYRAWAKAIKLMKKYKQWDRKFLTTIEIGLNSYTEVYGAEVDYMAKLRRLGEG